MKFFSLDTQLLSLRICSLQEVKTAISNPLQRDKALLYLWVQFLYFWENQLLGLLGTKDLGLGSLLEQKCLCRMWSHSYKQNCVLLVRDSLGKKNNFPPNKSMKISLGLEVSYFYRVVGGWGPRSCKHDVRSTPATQEKSIS